MAVIPQGNPTIGRIDTSMVEAQDGQWHRPHLGASAIGKPCLRALWYSFRWFKAPEFPGRILRLFRRGQNEEATVVEDLRRAGVVVSEGPEPGQQWRFSDINGHFGGSMDGAVLGLLEAPKTWHVLEIKTHNKKSFNAVEKHGVEKSKPEHFSQMQVYMHLSEMERACYIAVCKDDDRYYLERVKYDAPYAGQLLEKAEEIICTVEPPEKISDNPEYYLCKWCDYNRMCHYYSDAEVNCRTCEHSLPEMHNEHKSEQWLCTKKDKFLTVANQQSCDNDCEVYSRNQFT